MGQERAGAEWQSSNNSRYTAVEHGNVFHRRNVLLFPIVQIQSDRQGVMNLHGIPVFQRSGSRPIQLLPCAEGIGQG